METGTNTFFSKLNGMLRGEKTQEGEMLNRYSQMISQAICKCRTSQDIVCYRGSNHNMANGVECGETFVYRQFTSTSVLKKRAFRKRYFFIIHVPKGARAAYIEELSHFPRQYELLIDKNTLFKVLSKQANKIELEVIS